MNITYRTRRRMKRLGTFLLLLLMIAIIAWFCWVVWLERYVVYTRDGATIDFSLSAEIPAGEVAVPPAVGDGPGIYYNEGENAINTSTELTQLAGYYITAQMMIDDMAGVQERIATLSTGTPVMIELKGGYGSFYYSTGIEAAITSSSVDVAAVDALISQMKSKNLYLIAQVPAFRDSTYALNHVTSGVPYTGGGGALWLDSGGCYWLKPTDSGVLGWISSIILELRNMGFNEVVLSDFSVPEGDRIVYNGERATDLVSAASTLLTSCTTSTFTLSFGVSSSTFALPEGRCRMYLSGVSAKDVSVIAAQSAIAEPELHMVFIADTNDTRYDTYGVLRSLEVAVELENQDE